MQDVGTIFGTLGGMREILGTEKNWHWILPISLPPVFLQFFLSIFWLPESSYFLSKQKRGADAENSIKFYLNNQEDQKTHLQSLENHLRSDNEPQRASQTLHTVNRRIFFGEIFFGEIFFVNRRIFFVNR